MTLTPPGRPRIVGWTTLAFLVVMVTGLLLAMRPPEPVGAEAPAEAFSAERALPHVLAIAAAPHPGGTTEHDRVRDYLSGALRRLGLDVRLVEGTSANPRLGSPFAVGRVSTVVATLAGDTGAGTVYVDAHYDSVRNGPGANDNGVAVAAVIEVARAIVSQPRPHNSIVFALTDGEESGLLGARHLLDADGPSPRAAAVINLDARGSAGPAVMFETSDGNADLIGHLADAPQPLAFSLSGEVYKRLPNDTDFTEWRNAGFAGLNVAYLDASADYHVSTDALDRVNRAGLQHDGELLLSLTRSLGDADLSRKDSSADTYFWVPGVLLRYPNWLALPLALLAVVLLGGFMILLIRRGALRLRQLAFGVASMLLPVLAAPLFALLFWALATAVRPDYAAFVLGDPNEPGPLRAGLMASALIVTAAWYLLLRGRLGTLTLTVASVVWLTVLGVVATIAAPGAGYLFVLPALAWTAAGVGLGAARRPAWWPVGVGVGAAVAAVVGVPIIALLLPALGIANAAVPSLLLVLLAAPAMPLLDLVLPRRVWLTTASAAALVAVLLVVGLVTGPIDARHPLPTSLVYALDADTGQARWLSADPRPNEWTRAYVGDDRTELERDLPPLTGPFISSYLTGPAEAANLAAPEVSIVDSVVTDGRRTVRLHVRSGRAAPVLWLHVAADAPPILAAVVDGRAVPGDVPTAGPAGAWGWGFGFHALPASGIEVVLTFARADQVTLRVIDQADGLAGLPGITPRPADRQTSPLPSDASYVARTVRI